MILAEVRKSVELLIPKKGGYDVGDDEIPDIPE